MTRILMIGGFLGAGKTTAIARLGRMYQSRGLRVAIITNDHAGEIVDTLTFRSQGFQVNEIAGGCFCGNVEAFMSFLDKPGTAIPDVIFVEPIGSCIDLVATIIRPLRQQQNAQLDIAPYCVILKPKHAAKILGREQQGYSPKAEYLFRKQLEEADLIAVNRVDQLSVAEVDELTGYLDEQFPGVPVVRISARTGEGFEELVELLERQGEFGARNVDVDYQAYAAAEAELGWLNCSFMIQSDLSFDLDQFLNNIVEKLRVSLAAAGAETAHLKVIGLGDKVSAVVNLVSNDSPPEPSLEAGRDMREVRLVVNARVATTPAILESQVRRAISQAATELQLQTQETHFDAFQPGQPQVALHSISLMARNGGQR